MRQAHALAVVLGRIDEIFLRPNVAFERHNDILSNGIDGRVGDLRKELAEIVIEHTRLVAETGQRGVVAHGSNRIAQLVDERQKHELHCLGGESEGLHAREQCVLDQAVRSAGDSQVIELNSLVAQPFPVRPAGGEVGLDFLIWNHRALLEIHKKHPARLQTSLGLNISRINRDHTHFTGHDHAVVVRKIIAAWT